ncbi:ribonuclease R [Oceanicella actignis]|uniref:ribonuclease R n=1 Tax=Oceanicella actignis TaxID=1189325 RepID=UPI0011E794B8|nr:ribonuclease R [Oceanicella actignis]TYO91489.1 RNAse R [Oceanicella actignis]
MSRPFPTKQEILDWIRDNPGAAGKRDIARAFGLKGPARVELKRLLKEMAAEGLLEKRPRRALAPKGHMPSVAVLIALEPDASGDLFLEPQGWESDDPPPRILFVPRKGDPAPGPGDRLLCRLTRVHDLDHAYEARLIRRIGAGARRMLGVFRAGPDHARVEPIAKGDAHVWMVPPGAENGARDGELVRAEALDGPRAHHLGLPRARVIERLGDPFAARSVSLIAIHEHGIPLDFPQEAEDEARAARPVGPEGREDLRHLPLLTIDPADARDHDDAVCAMPDDDPANPGGHVVWVAIADVAHYVRPGSALDREARRRGNSTYFPDRVAPMLPEALSADLCSLHEGADRPCIAVRMTLDASGERRGHRFVRAIMRSAASLSYEQAQALEDGRADPALAPLEGPVRALFAAWRAADKARARRAPLALDLPERKVVLSPEGEVEQITFRERFDAHRVIEEFMILANVCAAETLERKRRPLIYRVHEEPGPDKMDALREQAEACGLVFPKGQVLRTRDFNRLLEQAAGGECAELINLAVLRAQTQAYYAPENLGHFGLNLPRYAHFTSPIRRYADLTVHRALISAHGWGPDPRRDGATLEEQESLKETAEHISFTERRSMTAERDTIDRYLAAFLKDRVGEVFEGRISGVARFGLFVKLDETGADALVPISSLGREYFVHDPEAQTLTGERTGRVIGLGQRVTVRLREAMPVTGGIVCELLSVEGGALAGGGRRGKARGKAPRRKLVKERVRRAKVPRRRP